ncbi:vanin-like protein 1 [Apis dorsata]|uniref:vanin-like protein 1 n=1 Tax=Apis dorsata TaxID=7462 RepID=UPI0003DF4985|nr:vanin-like protein 1 [Apis dorsata]
MKRSNNMRGKLDEFGLLLILVQFSYQMTIQNSTDYYTAAVVEFTPTYVKDNGPLTLSKNTDAYIEYIEKASKQNADIIVFPEDGLTSLYMPNRSHMDSWTTLVPSIHDNYVPCTNTSIDVGETLKRLSCAAKQNRIYVVINIAEKRLNNDECSSNFTWHYHNTNVAFDRMGKIIARYRKVNLYMEKQFDKTKIPEIVTFDTDFGVKFGTFICFDILFSVPALNLTRTLGISNIIFTTAWFSEVPFLTAIQIQFGWSFAENVNLLAAGYHQPNIGTLGSGIYLGRNGLINATMFSNPKYRLLISQVPKSTKSREIEERQIVQKLRKEKKENQRMKKYITRYETFDFYDKPKKTNILNSIKLLHDNVTSFESVLFNSSIIQSICYRNFCCDFEARIDTINNLSSIHYRAVVFNNVRLYGKEVEAGVRLCALIQCSNDSIRSCGFIGQSNITFFPLSITARFNDYPKILVMPSILNSSLLPFEQWSYIEHTYGKQTNLTIVLNEPTKNLVTFGIYARDFEKDK